MKKPAGQRVPPTCCITKEQRDQCQISSELRTLEALTSFDQLGEHSVGDVFLGSARRLLEPLVLFDVEHAGFLGFNEELDGRFRYGYDAYYYEIRRESHRDYKGEGEYGGKVMPTKNVGALPDGIRISEDSVDLMRWLLTASASILREGYAPLKDAIGKCALASTNYDIIQQGIEHFEWLQEELEATRLLIDERYDSPFVVTGVRVFAEDRFRDYLDANPDDNIALQHPPTAEKYL